MLINNAGVSHSNRAVELPAEEWQRVISTNLDAVFFWAQEAARRMLAAGKGGAIVNIASVLGLTPDKGIVAYAAAKAGVVQLTKALALELAFKGIRVNAIAPGWIMTEINHDYLSQRRGAAMKQTIPDGPLRRRAGPRRRPAAACLGRRTLHDRRDRRRRRRPGGGAAGLIWA